MTIIIGQILGIIAVILTFVSYQAKTDKQILIILSTATVFLVMHYCLIGATSGLALNIVCLLRNFAYFFKDKKVLSSPAVPYIFAAITVIYGIITWQAYYSIFIIIGLAVNTVALSRDPQTLRKSILLTSTLVLIYNIFVFSIGGIINEIVAIFSAVIGLIRFYRADKTAPANK